MFNGKHRNHPLPAIVLGALVLALGACDSTPPASNIDLSPQADSVFASLSQSPSAQRGYAVYRSHGCILCHGVNGEKGRKNTNAKTGEEVPSMTYIAEGYTKREFQKRVLTGVKTIQRKDTEGQEPPWRMPGWRGELSESELKDLTAYVWQLLPQDTSEEDDW